MPPSDEDDLLTPSLDPANDRPLDGSEESTVRPNRVASWLRDKAQAWEEAAEREAAEAGSEPTPQPPPEPEPPPRARDPEANPWLMVLLTAPCGLLVTGGYLCSNEMRLSRPMFAFFGFGLMTGLTFLLTATAGWLTARGGAWSGLYPLLGLALLRPVAVLAAAILAARQFRAYQQHAQSRGRAETVRLPKHFLGWTIAALILELVHLFLFVWIFRR